MLGSAQAVAQMVEGATYADNTVTVTMADDEVRVSSGTADDLPFSAFTIAGNPATAHTVAATATGALTFTVTFTNNLAGISTQMTYTEPSTGARIVDATSGGGVGDFTVTVLPATPWLPPLPIYEVQRGVAADITLPEAVGGTETLTYSIASATPLPTGLTFDDDTRKITGTTTAAAGRSPLTYEVTDGTNSNTAASFIDVVEPPALSVVVSADPTTIPEGGVSTITAMANRPVTEADGMVTIHLGLVGEGAATLSANAITIAMGQMSGTAMLTSTADDDYVNDTVTLTVTGTGIAANHPNIEIVVTDMAPPAALTIAVSASPTTIPEGGMSTITAMANRDVVDADGMVTINLGLVGDATLSATSITIPMGSDMGTAMLTSTADDDYVAETVTLTVSGTAIAANHPNIVITVTDPPPPSALTVKVSADPMTIKEGGTSTIKAMANRVVEVADGMVTVNLSVVGDAKLSASSITILAGKESGTAMLTSTQDDDYMDDTVTVTASGTGITGNQEVTITVTDDESAPSTTLGQITAISVDGSTEKDVGGTKRQHVTEGVLTKATITVQWSHAQLRELWQGVPTGSKPPDVPVTLQMMPVPSAESWLSEAENEAGHDDVTIGTAAMVVVPKKPKSDTSVGYEEGTGSTSIHFGLDPDAENEAFKLYVTDASGFAADSLTESKVHVIEDIDPQNIVLKRDGSGVIYEGRSDVKFDVTADPPREDLALEVRFDLKDVAGQTVESRDNYIDKSIGTIPPGTGSAAKDTVTLTLDNNDGNRENDQLALHAEVVIYALDTGAYRGIDNPDPVMITVVDVHKLPPLTVMSPADTVAEGGTIELTLTLNRNPPDTIVIDGEKREYTSEPVDVTLMGSPTGLVQISPRPVKFPKHDGKAPWTQEMKVMVEAMTNNTIDADRTVMIASEGAGTIAANGMQKRAYTDQTVSLTVTDGNKKLVYAKTQEEVEAAIYAAKNAGAGEDMTFTKGEMIEVMGSALFSSAEGVTVSYTADSDMEDVASASVSGGTVMVEAKGEGMAHITITAHASMPSTVKILDQTDPREASIKFPVEVGLEALTIMISGPDDMNIVEGTMDHANGTMAGAMVTAKTNRPVTQDVTVMLMRDRAMSSAGDEDFMAEPIVIEADSDMGSTMVMAVDDGIMENMDNMPEELVLYGMAEGMAGEVTGQVKLYIWDYPVPALPIIAQLLLAAFLAIGGYRRYRRR